MAKTPQPKVNPVSPLHRAKQVPLQQMLNDLGRQSGMNPKQQAGKILEMQLGPRRDLK